MDKCPRPLTEKCKRVICTYAENNMNATAEQLHSGISFDSGKGKDWDKSEVVFRADRFA